MTGTAGNRCFSAATIRRVGAITQRSNSRSGKHAGPAVEQLHGLGARRDLTADR